MARAGVASTTASACDDLGVAGGADHEVPAAAGPAGQVAHGRAGADRGAGRAARASASRRHSPADARRTPAERPSDGGGVAAAAARVSERSRSSSATSWGTAARAEISRAWPAYTPPSRGSTSRSTTSLPSRSSTRSPTLMSRSPSSVGGSTVSSAARATPLAEITPSSARRSSGHAHQRARHRDQAAAGPQVRRDRGRVHQVVAEPDLAGEADRLGPPVEHRLGADVDHDAADLGGAQAAADPRRGLQHDHLGLRQLLPEPVGGGQPGHAAADDGDDAVWRLAFGHVDSVAQRCDCRNVGNRSGVAGVTAP